MKPLTWMATTGSMLLLSIAPALCAQEPAGPPTPPSQPATTETQQQSAPSARANSAAVPAIGSSTSPASARPANAKPDQRIQLPAGTHIPLVLHNAISTRSSQVGDPVYFETSFPVLLNGKIIVPAGSWVSGEVTELKRAGRVKGRAELTVRLTTLILPNAYVVSLTASPSNAGTGGHETTDREGRVIGDSDKASDAGTVMKTTTAGAGIGALASRSAAGAGIGAGIGAATGVAAVLLTRGPDAELPRGTTLDAVLDHSILLDADKVQFASPGQASSLPGPPNRAPQRMAVPF
jgi:type IV secretory pathway VirB10-like protein